MYELNALASGTSDTKYHWTKTMHKFREGTSLPPATELMAKHRGERQNKAAEEAEQWQQTP